MSNSEKAEIERLKRLVEFINLWLYRESQNLTDGERLSAIKYHPTLRDYAKEANYY